MVRRRATWILGAVVVFAGCANGPLKLRPHDSVFGPYRITWVENLPGYPRTAIIAPWDAISLLREYHVRTGTLPDAQSVAANVTDGSTPLHQAVSAFRTQDEFKKREAQAVIASESQTAFLAHDPSAYIALQLGVQIQPFDFNTGTFTVCLTALCAGQSTWVAPVRARDYRLEVRNMPGRMTWRPQNEAVARQIEAGASQQFPRGMDVRLIVALDKNVQPDLVVRGTLVAVAIYRRDSLGDAHQFDPQRLLGVEPVEPPPTGSSSPTQQVVSPSRVPANSSDVPEEIAASVGGYAKSCEPRQPLQRGPGWLRSLDVDGDGEADYVLDGTKVDCRGTSLWGTGGSPFIVFLQRRGRVVKAFEQAIGDFRVVARPGNANELQVQVGGPLCRQHIAPGMVRTQMLPCWRPVEWSRTQQRVQFAPVDRIEVYSQEP